MAPNSRIYLMRHAQGEHNVSFDANIRDPVLTARGQRQCESFAQKSSEWQQKVDLIVTSPLRRTLETTLIGWAPAVERLGIENVICLPEAQECNGFLCDTGSSREDLEKNSKYAGFDFSRLVPEWNSKKGFWACDAKSEANRAKVVRQFLRDRPELDIVFVSHGDFLREVSCDDKGPSMHFWSNAEVQIWKFDENTIDKRECFLRLDETFETAGRYDPTSSEIIKAKA